MRIVDSNKNILLVDSEASYTTVGLIENGRLSELYSESADERQTSGNIYKGKVTNVVDGLRSAFVDIGLNRTGFWYIDEALDHKSVLGAVKALPSKITAKEGDYVMVQAVKEATELKGPKLSSNISIPGHYVIYLYNLEFVGVSTKITSTPLRDRLTKLLKSLAPKGRALSHAQIVLRRATRRSYRKRSSSSRRASGSRKSGKSRTESRSSTTRATSFIAPFATCCPIA